MQTLHRLLVRCGSERCQRPHTLKVHKEKDRQRERSHRKQCACHRCDPLPCNGPPAASKQCGGGDEPTRHQAKDATHGPQTKVLEGAVPQGVADVLALSATGHIHGLSRDRVVVRAMGGRNT